MNLPTKCPDCGADMEYNPTTIIPTSYCNPCDITAVAVRGKNNSVRIDICQGESVVDMNDFQALKQARARREAAMGRSQ